MQVLLWSKLLCSSSTMKPFPMVLHQSLLIGTALIRLFWGRIFLKITSKKNKRAIITSTLTSKVFQLGIMLMVLTECLELHSTVLAFTQRHNHRVRQNSAWGWPSNILPSTTTRRTGLQQKQSSKSRRNSQWRFPNSKQTMTTKLISTWFQEILTES